MKKKRLRTYMGVVVSLLMIVTTVCCENQQQKDNIAENIDPIIVADDLAVTIGQWVSSREETEELFGEYSLDLFNGEGFLKDIKMINDYREGLEGFDFENYSLVVGRIVYTMGGYYIDSVGIGISNEAYLFDVYSLIKEDEIHPAAITPVYFWRVYEKLNESYKIEILFNIDAI